MSDVADRVGVGLRPETLDFVEGELGSGRNDQKVIVETAAVAEETWDRWARARLLPAQVEIATAAGDVERARSAVDELTAIVVGYPSPALEAGRRVALGRVLLAEGDAPAT